MTNLNPYTSHFSFNDRFENVETDAEYEELKKLLIEEVTLPSFYTFKEQTPVYEVNINSTNPLIIITVNDSEGEGVGGTFSDLEEAYDFVTNNLQGDVKFAGDIKAITGKDDNFFVTVESKNNPKFRRLLLARSDSSDEYLAKASYYEFLKTTNEYEENPTDFRTSFYWLDTHPAFWSRIKADSHDWETSNNDKIWLGVTADKAGKTCIMLETGSAVEPDRTSHYHDLRLDTYTSTYEEGIIALAALVHKFFNVDGSERENVEYEKSQLELDLERLSKEASENY